VLAGGRCYEYDPKRGAYVEHIWYHSDPSMNGGTLRFEARMKGGTWYHIGEVGDYKLREVWERVDSKRVQVELRGNTMSEEGPSVGSRDP
jgi:hypothetical protein